MELENEAYVTTLVLFFNQIFNFSAAYVVLSLKFK